MNARSSPAERWGTLGLLSGLNFLNYLDRYVMAAVLVPMQAELGLNDFRGGSAASAFMLGYFLTAPFFGYLGDRWPRRWLMLAGVMVWSAATAASGLTHSFGALYAVRIAVGVGEAAFVSLCPSWISDLFASTKRNTALTLFYVAIPVGSAIGYTIGGQFAQHGDWRHAFFWAGLPGIVLALSLLFLREPSRGEADGVASAPPQLHWGEIGALLVQRRYALLVWGYTAQTFALGAFAVWGPKFLHQIHGLPQGWASSIFGQMLAFTGLTATLLGGWIANRLRDRTAAGYAWLMAGSMLAAAPVSLWALLAGDSTLTLVLLGAAMFLIFLPTGPINAELIDVVPVHLRATAVALCIFVTHLFGDFGSPSIVGLISDASHSLRTGTLLLPAVLLLGAGLWLLLVRAIPARSEVTP